MVKTVTDADLLEQFKLARQINDKVSAANEAVLRIRNVKEQVSDRLTKTKDSAITTAAEPLVARLTAVEGEIYQYRNRSSQDPLNYPIRLNNKLAALAGVVGSADTAPTAQSYAVYDEVVTQIDAQLQKLAQIMSTDVPAFNKLVRDQNIPAVVVK